jgi:pyruvate/2-oxoglutarate dehydrogenase complex dihydrolipoamide dehydrogenase (E3) component
VTNVVIIGGGPGGYEAALVARQLGAAVTIVESQGLGGSAVLTDVVPSKALIAVAEAAIDARTAGMIGVHASDVTVDLGDVNKRLRKWAATQSHDVTARVMAEGVTVIAGWGRLTGPSTITVDLADGGSTELTADVILLATGARPRILDTAIPDGQRIMTWEQLYELDELPEKLIVVGSGVTGAEFAGAYQALGSQVVLVSSRDRVLPGEDADAAQVVEKVFRARGMTVQSRSRAESVVRTDHGVAVRLSDGTVLEGSHCLLAVGSLPNTESLGLDSAGVEISPQGYVQVDGVSRTNVRGIYAAGDCTGVLLLASVAAMQGRIAMWHALGDAVEPLRLDTVSSNVFTDPEIATVGVTQADVESGDVTAETVLLPLATNARAKMQGITEGFVKLYAQPGSEIVVGGVVVAPKASELIYPIALAVRNRLTVADLTSTFTVYPSLTGSIAEAARRLHHADR